MIFIFFLCIRHEQDITDQCIQPIPNPDTVFIILSCKEAFHLPLSFEFRFHVIDTGCLGRTEKCLFHIIGMRAEYLSEKGFMNIGHQIFLPEGKAVTFDFFLTHRDGGNELSQQSMHGMHRDFPNTEETKNMVNPVCIEVFRHFLKTLHPPTITILFHNVPVVGRKSPILSVYREVVGRGARLSVEVEVMRFCPCFHTIAADTDRNISFECDTVFAGIFRSGYQLQVQMKLNIKIECDMRIIYRFRLTHLLYILSIINSMSGPFAEIRRLEGVAQITENRIRL